MLSAMMCEVLVSPIGFAVSGPSAWLRALFFAGRSPGDNREVVRLCFLAASRFSGLTVPCALCYAPSLGAHILGLMLACGNVCRDDL